MHFNCTKDEVHQEQDLLEQATYIKRNEQDQHAECHLIKAYK